MSNGAVCCILGVCCPPDPDPGGRATPGLPENTNPKRREKLAKEIAGAFERGGQESAADCARGAANFILDNYDLVPRGLGTAIVEAYRPEFEKLHNKEI